MRSRPPKSSIRRSAAGELTKSRRFEDLVRIMDLLLGKGGCPWDRKQTHGTLLKYLREEADEDSDFLKVFARKAGFRPHSNFMTSLARRLDIPVEVLGFLGHTLVSPFAALAAGRLRQAEALRAG